jgi:hypothetical protein
VNGPPTCSCTRVINFNDFGVFEVAGRDMSRMVKLESGRMPDPSSPDQVLASFTLQQDYGVRLGTVIRVPFAARSQYRDVLNNANFTPSGPTMTFRVVGFEASETEFPASTTPSYDIFTTPAFATAVNPKTVVLYGAFVRLRRGASDLPSFMNQAKALGGLSVSDLDVEATELRAAVQPQAVGWWALAGLAGLGGLIIVAQALARQATEESEPYTTLWAIGVPGRQLVVLGMNRALLVGAAGAAFGLVLAFFLSPLTLVGEPRLAVAATGFAVDTPVFLLGLVVTVAIVLGLGTWPAVRTANIQNADDTGKFSRPSRTVAVLAGRGAPPSVIIGVRNALERGRGRRAIPVGSAMLGAVLAVAALSATAVFGTSLARLTSTPALYGQDFDLSFAVNQTGGTAQNEQMLAHLERPQAITDVTVGITGNLVIDGHVVISLVAQNLRGRLLMTTVAGRLPSGQGEVALGATTLHQLGLHLGSTVLVSAGKALPESRSRVVGEVVFAPNAQTGGLGTGALALLSNVLAKRCPPGPGEPACLVQTAIGAGGAFIVRAAPGPEGRATLARLAQTYSSAVTYPEPPTNLVSFGEAVNFPLIFGLVLAVFGAATLTHLLIVSAVRRRHEVGLLKALGFVRAQVAFAVAWQTTTVGVVGIVVGVPVGTAAGRVVWRLFAENLGVPPAPVVRATAIALVAAGTVVVANLLAIGPAILASRLGAADLLKAE